MRVGILWSAVAIAAEKEEAAAKSKEAQIKEIKGQIRELEIALEREDNKERAAKLKEDLQERRKKIQRLMGNASEKPKGQFAEIDMAIKRSEGKLKEFRQTAVASREKGDQLEKRRAEARSRKPQPKLMFFNIKYANAGKLADIIKKFLSPGGIIAADPDTNTLIIKDSPDGLETASIIIKNLDVQRRRGPRDQPVRRDQPQRREQPQRGDQPQRRQASRETMDRENVFFGKVLEANRESLTIETRDSKEKVTLFVPSRRREDGTQALPEELSMMVSKLEVGSSVRVQWRQGDARRLIVRVAKIEGDSPR